MKVLLSKKLIYHSKQSSTAASRILSITLKFAFNGLEVVIQFRVNSNDHLTSLSFPQSPSNYPNISLTQAELGRFTQTKSTIKFRESNLNRSLQATICQLNNFIHFVSRMKQLLTMILTWALHLDIQTKIQNKKVKKIVTFR